SDLEDGAWTVEVEMPGFTSLSRTVNIAASEIAQFDLRLASLQAPNQEQAATPRRKRDASPGAQNASVGNGTPANRPNFAGPGRGGQRDAAGRPSIQQSLAGGGFQRLDVNAQNAGALQAEAEPSETLGLN